MIIQELLNQSSQNKHFGHTYFLNIFHFKHLFLSYSLRLTWHEEFVKLLLTWPSIEDNSTTTQPILTNYVSCKTSDIFLQYFSHSETIGFVLSEINVLSVNDLKLRITQQLLNQSLQTTNHAKLQTYFFNIFHILKQSVSYFPRLTSDKLCPYIHTYIRKPEFQPLLQSWSTYSET